MEQWKIAAEIYNQVLLKLSDISYAGVEIKVVVNDICQCMVDKSGQRIIVDEKQYEQPAVYELSIQGVFEGCDTGSLLQAYGEVAVLFKDEPDLTIEKCNWHGSPGDTIYLEPVIRHVDCNKVNFFDGKYRFELGYKTEFSINSQKATGFKRVEKRDIHGVVKK